jgi:hypothetical protein
MPIGDPLTQRQRSLFHKVYRALTHLGTIDPEAATPAIAAARLLLIDAAGEERERALTIRWNREPQLQGRAGAGFERRLAEDGIAFAFVSAGMPVAWASRFNHLFCDMLKPPGEAQNYELRRDELREQGEFGQARIWGNSLIAASIIAGDAPAVRQSAIQNLEILRQWRAAEPDLGRDYEFEEHAWLRSNAERVAGWGLQVQNHLARLRNL